MERRKCTREFKLEAVKLIQERGVTVAQAVRDLGVQGSVLRRWVQECAADSQQAFPGQGQMKPEQAELARLRREVIKLKAERDILKKPRCKRIIVAHMSMLINLAPSRSRPATRRAVSDRPGSIRFPVDRFPALA
jgi:transposase